MTVRKREPRLQRMLPGDRAPAYLEDLPEDTYLTDFFSAKRVDFIRRHQGDPWFLFLSIDEGVGHVETLTPKR